MNWLRKLMGKPTEQPRCVGNNVGLKTIVYRGGLVTFRIPDNWIEEYGEEGGGTFYEEAPDSTTFRLEVISMEPSSPVTSESAPKVLSTLGSIAPGTIEQLPGGCALVRYEQFPTDRGHQLCVTYWSVAHVIPPNHVRLATFSHTMLEHQRGDARFQEELALLDREVRACTFSSVVGV
ncbi:MAG: hypothetical protein ABIR47_15945 [Candidatus Kapaibacterium sp.]